MTILPNYLIKYILECILNYKYNRNEYEFLNIFTEYKIFKIINNETITLSLVCRKWFEMISNHCEEIFNFQNYLILTQFTKNKRKKLNLIKKFSINYIMDSNQSNIKIKEGYLLSQFNLQRNNMNRIFKILSINQPKQCQFLLKTRSKDFSNFDGSKFTNCQYYNNLMLKMEGNFSNQIIKEIQKINPRHLQSYSFDSTLQYQDCSLLFDMDSIETLIILNNDHVDPIAITKINNSKTKLKNLSIQLQFHEIIKSSSDNGGCDSCRVRNIKYEKSIQQDYNQMIETLKSNSTLRCLELRNFCHNYDKIRNPCISSQIDRLSNVTLGLKELFTSPTSSINTLLFENIDFFQDQLLLNGLSEMKKLFNLCIYDCTNLNEIFNKVLTNNKSIRNLFLKNYKLNQLINLLNLNPSIELYSITLISNMDDENCSNINNIKSFLNQLNCLNNIKEFIFIDKKYINFINYNKD